MVSAWRDFLYSLRTLRRYPITTLVIILTLAVGIAGNVFMFAGFEAWVLRPLDFEKPDDLVFIHNAQPSRDRDQIRLSAPAIFDLQRATRTLRQVGGFQRGRFNILGDESPRRVQGTLITPSLFPLLGVGPEIGRNLIATEALPEGPETVALISHDLWRDNFEGRPDILDQSLLVDGEPHRIVGVMPEGFAFPEFAEIWLPLSLDPAADRSQRTIDVVGRRESERSLDDVNQELSAITDDLATRYPQPMETFQLRAMDLRRSFVPPVIDTALLSSMGAAVFVLLIICTNVASLLMAQSTARSSELALMSALGASRNGLARRLTIESLILATVGGVLGSGLGWLANDWMLASLPVTPPYLFEFRYDLRVAIFVVAISFATGIACALAPLWRNSGVNLVEALKQGSGRTASVRGGSLRQVLVTGQFATSVVLALGAALMVASFLKQQQVDPGYSTQDLVVVDISMTGNAYQDLSSRIEFVDRALRSFGEIPGVSSAGAVDRLPLSNRGYRTVGVEAEGYPRQPGEEEQMTLHTVTSGYLSTLELPILEGRSFSSGEQETGEEVVILSSRIVPRLWPDASALGRRVRFGKEGEWMRVIGVAADTDPGHQMVDAGQTPRAQAYIPYAKARDPRVALVVRSEQGLDSLAPILRSRLHALDPALPVQEVLTMDQVIEQSQWVLGFFTRTLTVYAVLAILICALGAYGIATDAVTQRRREMAIRKALGAQSSDVYGLVIREGTLSAVLGILMGCGVSFLVLQFMSGMFFDVSARDPIAYGACAALMGVVALASCMIPARRANRVDILETLRS